MALATPGDAPSYEYRRLSNNIAHVSPLSAFRCAYIRTDRAEVKPKLSLNGAEATRIGTPRSREPISSSVHLAAMSRKGGCRQSPRHGALHKKDRSPVVSSPTRASGLRSRRGLIVTACLLAVATGIGTYIMRRGVIPAEASRGQPPAVPVSISAASRRDVPIHLTGLGTVQATFTVGIHSQVDGKLQDVFFKEGQRVKKGDAVGQDRSAAVPSRA